MLARLGVPAFLLLVACNGQQKLGTYNTPPAVAISNPVDGSSFNQGIDVDFEGMVSDDAGAETTTIQWTSDVQGLLTSGAPDSTGAVSYHTSNLNPGNHTITLIATDSQAATGQASITVSIIELPEPPTISIVHPASGESGQEGVAFDFVALVADAQDAPDKLKGDVVSDKDGKLCNFTIDATGEATCNAKLSAGTHHLTFEVTDTDGNKTTAPTLFAVTAASDIDNDGDGWTETQGDCNDTDPSIHPGATEVCNSVDDDCDKIIDEDTDCYDDDGDGYTEDGGDCNDSNPAVHPGATELCNGADDDCDTTIDEDPADGTTYYTDGDGDGYGGTGTVKSCSSTPPAGTAATSSDCNDGNSAINPGATEVCDGIDNNCNGVADDPGSVGCTKYYQDNDGDGYGAGTAECLCAPSAKYTVTNNSDCYDSNALAKPGQTAYFTTSRGDGSFDYDCSGAADKEYTTTGGCSGGGLSSCTSNPAGWYGSVPSCGSSAAWLYDCSWYIFTCDADTETQIQGCH